ncbi:vitamin B12 dependent-methionine synthase activation domain-containing protein [Elusimicrobiota bacterium]
MSTVKKLSNIKLKADAKEFVSRQASLRGQITPKINEIIKELGVEVQKLAIPAAYYRVKEIEKNKGGKLKFKTNGDSSAVEFELSRVSFAFNNSRYAIPFVCTIGDDVEKRLNFYKKKKDPIRTWLFDLICSYFTEKLADKMQEKVANTFKNMSATRRFSPGYCSWKLSEQKKVFKFFKDSYVNVSLNKGYMMHPRKSVSGIFGLVEKTDKQNNPCTICPNKKCQERRA